jgi:hypothetical protein
MTNPVAATSTFPTSNASAVADHPAEPAGYYPPVGYYAPTGYYPPAAMAPAAPAPSTRSGLPWLIAGATLLAIAVCHLLLLPEWVVTRTTEGVVGNLTGVVALVGIGAGLLAVGITRRRQQR